MLSTSISAYLHIAYIIVYMYTVYRSILLSKSILLIRYNNSCSCSLGATRTAPLLALPLVLRQTKTNDALHSQISPEIHVDRSSQRPKTLRPTRTTRHVYTLRRGLVFGIQPRPGHDHLARSDSVIQAHLSEFPQKSRFRLPIRKLYRVDGRSKLMMPGRPKLTMPYTPKFHLKST